MPENIQTVKLHRNLTFQFVVFRVNWKKDIWEELFKTVASIFRPVLHVRPDGWLQLLHEFGAWGP